jgi:uroporphyrinogen-III synthase
VSVLQHNFIRLQPNNASLKERGKYDWVFFSSPKSVRLFSENYSINSDAKLAALSERTKREIEIKFNTKVDFVGSEKSVVDTAFQFNQVVTTAEKVLFPIGEESRRTVLKAVDSDNWFDFIFYKTVISDKLHSGFQFDAAFLSSPSQAKGWITSIGINQKCQIFSFAGSSNLYLESQGIDCIAVDNFQRESVFEAFISHLGQTD